MTKAIKVSIWLIILLGLVALSAFFFDRYQSNTQSNISQNQPIITKISFNGSTFSPQIAKIKHGTMITFVNNSSVLLQISSENVGFSSDKILNQGDFINFTFKALGEFDYNNGKNINQKGKVIVQ